jgi:4-carboxymuconolactone decarboxylase
MEKTNTLFPKGNKLPNDWFTGNAFVTPLIAKDNSRVSKGDFTPCSSQNRT